MQSPAAPKPQQEGEEERELSILLWNVWLLPGPLSDWNTTGRAAEIPSHISMYDIILLNEAFTHQSQIINDMKSTHPHVATLSRPFPLWPVFDSGLIIFSRFPIKETRSTIFTKRRMADFFAGKGSLMARIEVSADPAGTKSDPAAKKRPYKTVDIYNTHMQAGNTKDEHSARASQSIQLGQFVTRTSTTEDQVILGGDLNMGPERDSGHFANGDDARQRVEQYESLRKESGLETVVVNVPGRKSDINRYLQRGVEVISVEYPPVPTVQAEGSKKGSRMSDSDLVVLKVKV